MNTENYTIEQFADMVTRKLEYYLPKEMSLAKIEQCVTTKHNDQRFYGIRVTQLMGRIAPVVYLESYYKKYKTMLEDCELEEDVEQCCRTILREIADAYMKHKNDIDENIDLDFIWDFNKVADKIFTRVCKRDWNHDRLEGRPRTNVCDLAVTYYIAISEANDKFNGIASVQITYDMLERWGITIEQLHEKAVENIDKANDIEFIPMGKLLAGMLGDMGKADLLSTETVESCDVGLYVITHQNKMFGSNAILSSEFMNTVYNMFEGKFYILPSSIHELIVVDARDHNDAHTTNTYIDMVNEVNTEQVDTEDMLSDTVYTWNPAVGLIQLGYNDVIK